MRIRTFAQIVCYISIIILHLGCGNFTQSGKGPELAGYTEFGKASYYAMKFESGLTASGERYRQSLLTAAHKKLPFGTKVLVTNTKNGKSVKVKINDRGPFIKGRIIGLSRSAFSKIGDLDLGVIDVKIETIK